MNELIKFAFTDWINFFLVLITGFILYMGILSGIRIIIETAIPKGFELCCKHFFTMKSASEIAHLNIIKQEFKNNDN